MAGVLFICTGNLCRSPSAAALLTKRIGHDGPSDVAVSSAGTLQATGSPPSRLVTEAQAYGLDLSGHQPRRMTRDDLAQADLIIAMTRAHRREVVLLERDAFTRTFTLREFVRRGHEVGPRRSDQPLADWRGALHGGRHHMDLVGESAADDIADPMGGPTEGYRRMLSEVASHIDAVYALLWGAPKTV